MIQDVRIRFDARKRRAGSPGSDPIQMGAWKLKGQKDSKGRKIRKYAKYNGVDG